MSEVIENLPAIDGVPPYRVRKFAHGVAARLRDGLQANVAAESMLQQIAQERTALAAALAEPAMANALAEAYRAAIKTVSPSTEISADAAHEESTEVLQNRIRDAKALAQLVINPAFIQHAQALAAQPAAQLPPLPSEKIEEMVARFAMPPAPYGMDPKIHRHQAMEGQRLGHLALAEAFTNGGLQPVLEKALHSHWPQGSPADISRLAADWLEARTGPARATAETLREGGEVYQRVMAFVPPAQPITPALQRTTMLTPAALEAHKTGQQKAEDVIYTLNHAIVCLGLTDTLIAPAIAAASQRWFGKKVTLCGHDHGDGHHHHQHEHKKGFFGSLKNWVIGEAVGDVGAVIPTLMLQRFAPGFMNGIRHVMEPVVGGWFRRGAERGARQWAEKHGIAPNAPEAKQRASELYEYEVGHLPQMAVWTVSSVGINFGVMKLLDENMDLWKFMQGKTLGAAVTAALVMGARATLPNAAHGWDGAISQNIIVPMTKILGRPFGVRAEHVDAHIRKRSGIDAPQWQGTVQPLPAQQVVG